MIEELLNALNGKKYDKAIELVDNLIKSESASKINYYITMKNALSSIKEGQYNTASEFIFEIYEHNQEDAFLMHNAMLMAIRNPSELTDIIKNFNTKIMEKFKKT